MHKLTVIVFLASCTARAGLQTTTSPSASPSPTTSPPPTERPVTSAPVTNAPAFPPGNWTLGEREFWQKAYDDALQYVNLMNKDCGTQIDFRYEHEELRALMTPTGLHARAKSFTADVAGTVRNLCLAGAMQKQAVQKDIQRIVIGKKPHALASGTLVGAVDENANPRQYSYDFRDFVKGAL